MALTSTRRGAAIGCRSGSSTDYCSLVKFDPDFAKSNEIDAGNGRSLLVSVPQQLLSESRFSQFQYQQRCTRAKGRQLCHQRLLPCWQAWI